MILINTLILFCSNFSNYKARFSMPGGYESMMYSFNLGPAHFISISTEFYYFLYYGIKPVVLQYEWLVNDLKVSFIFKKKYISHKKKSIKLYTQLICTICDTKT